MEEQVITLSRYRFETAVEALEDARIMYERGRYKNTLNRAYYAIFHSIRAVNALSGYDSSKHSGVISYFNLNYVKTEIMPKELSRIIREASENRERADYLDFYVASGEEAGKQIDRATEFLNTIRDFLVSVNVLNNKK